MNFKLVSTEKAVRLIEAENTLVVEISRAAKKPEIKKLIEDMFKVKIDSINTLIKANKKYVYVKLNKDSPAIDVATNLGMI
tara:strand:- start:402 stop:644 length:243 start_codon:yes stop_codon:yes gene_type:complete